MSARLVHRTGGRAIGTCSCVHECEDLSKCPVFQADVATAHMLVPAHLLNKMGRPTVQDVADRFGVHRDGARFRLSIHYFSGDAGQ